MINKKATNLLGVVVVFVISLGIYLLTLCPTIYLEDSAEFVTAAATLGIPHPSGYPLYVILGRLFSFFPIGNIAWRINFMSAVFGATATVMLFLLLKEYILNKKINQRTGVLMALTGALILPLTRIFWSQAIVAEVYTLNCFLFLLVWWLLLKWAEQKNAGNESKEKKYFYLLWLVYGLSLTNHTMMILFLPVIVGFILWQDKMIEQKKMMLLKASLLGLLGLMVYLFLPGRAEMEPALNWGETSNLGNFINHVTRRAYQDFDWQIWHNFNSKVMYLMALGRDLINQFTWLGVILAGSGIYALGRKNKKMFFLSMGFFAMNTVAIIFLRKGDYTLLNDHFFSVYYLPAYAIFCLWIVNGWWHAWLKIKKWLAEKKNIRIIIQGLLIGVLVFLPVINLKRNWQVNNYQQFYWLNNYSQALLNSLEKKAVLVINEDYCGVDNILFSVAYQQMSQDLRPDVYVISLTDIFNQPGDDFWPLYNNWPKAEKKQKTAEYLWQKYGSQRPVYLFYPLAGNDNGLATRSNGLAYRVYNNIKEAKADQKIIAVLSINDENNHLITDNYLGRELLGQIYFARVSYFLENNDLKSASAWVLKAIQVWPGINTEAISAYQAERVNWLKK